MESPSFLGSKGCLPSLALHRAREQSAGEPALNEDEEDQARERREQRGRGQRAEPHDSLDTHELGEPERQRRQVGGVQQDEREEELVPGGDEREEGGHDDAGQEQWRDHGPEHVEATGPVDHCRLFEVGRDAADVALEHPEDERERPDDVHEDESTVRVREVQLAEHEEQRDDDEDQREELAEQDPAEPGSRDDPSLPREDVRGRETDEADQDRGRRRDLEAVPRGVRDVGVPQDLAVVVERRLGRDEGRVQLDELARSLQRHREQPEQREAEEDDVEPERGVLEAHGPSLAGRDDHDDRSRSRPQR
jgi:hypothetical protein